MGELTLEEAFQKTAKFIFGREIEGELKDYEKWLSREIPQLFEKKSILSNKKVYIKEDITPVISNDEKIIGSSKIEGNLDEAETLKSIINKVKPIVMYTGNRSIYNSSDIQKSDICLSSKIVCNSFLIQNSSHMSHCFDLNLSQMVFGSKFGREVSSSINAYSCLKVANCFETAFCGNSSNCLFCYDGSNLDNCMFCFSDNAKKYAIGNLEVGKKRFFELKNIVVDELFQELEKNKSLKMNIFNLLKM